MIRFHLPPNFAAAAGRDAVPLRVDFDTSATPRAELLPVLALLQRWCATAAPPKFIQLSRAQLRELAAAAGDEAIFVENGQPTPWRHAGLVADPAPKPGSAPAPTDHRPRSAAPPTTAAPLVVDGGEHFIALTLPAREHPLYAEALALVKEHGFVLEPSNRKWWLRDRHKSLCFLAAHLQRLREAFGAQFTANFEKNTTHLRPAEITAEITPDGADYAVTLGLRAGTAGEPAVRAALAANRGYVESEGRIFLLEARKIAQLAAAQRALAGDPAAGAAARRTQRIPAARAAEADGMLEELSPGFQSPESWRVRSAPLRNLSSLPPAPVPAALDTQLRPYQRLGAAWLWHLRSAELGGILADEMGLGKTIQALALLAVPGRRGLPPSGPSLVVCPASLLENWRREAARFSPQQRVFVHHAGERLRAPADFAGHDLIITSYGTLTRDQALFGEVPFDCVVADEAQHIKNRRSQNAAALRTLRARSRFVLTGTPLENSLDDLRSLFEFLLPGFLARLPPGLRGDERTWFDERLRAQTAPYILRRTKAAVAPELPEKIETILWCELAPDQARLYRDTQEAGERELFDLEAGGANEATLRFTALTQLLRLRQICCDPRLLPASGPRTPAAPRDAAGPPEHRGPEPAPPEPFADSAKLDAFNELLAEAIDDGHRLLVFSQFTSLLALLRADLDSQQIPCCYLDGAMPARARQAEVDRFQASADIPLFLLSLKAGGTGLNLTGADTVVHFDPWWNPAAEAQATDRAHRIGQKRVVTSYKLIASGTVEEKVLALQAEKRALLAGVFEASDAATAKLSLGDLKALLAV